jgi:DNA topoisomerase-1
VAKVIRSCQDLPGQHLFEYRGPDGAVHAVSSTDVNQYLRQISGQEISAKDFRTWAGTVRAAMAFSKLKAAPSKRVVRAVVAEVAEVLGNTVTVCRKCYIHPRVIAGFESGALKLPAPRRRQAGLSAAEQSVLAFLQRRAR